MNACVDEVVSAADHDFSGCNITPPVNLVVDPLDTADAVWPGLWYNGHVVVSLKDATLQASNPWRHVAKLHLSLSHLGKLGIKVCSVQSWSLHCFSGESIFSPADIAAPIAGARP